MPKVRDLAHRSAPKVKDLRQTKPNCGLRSHGHCYPQLVEVLNDVTLRDMILAFMVTKCFCNGRNKAAAIACSTQRLAIRLELNASLIVGKGEPAEQTPPTGEGAGP